MWFGLLDHRGRLVRMPASVCRAYDCSVCYVQCDLEREASTLALVMTGTVTESTREVFR